MEYALKKGLSISTLRRYIKSGRVKHMMDRGRYFIYDGEDEPHPRTGVLEAGSLQIQVAAETDHLNQLGHECDSLKAKVEELETKLRKANEQVAELGMLVKIYEDKLFNNQT